MMRKIATASALVILLLAVPIVIQVYFNAGLAYWLSRKFGVAWCVAAPAARFFEETAPQAASGLRRMLLISNQWRGSLVATTLT